MKSLKIITSTLILLALAVTVAIASESAGGAHGEGGHHYNWKDFAFRVVNFIVFIAIIWKFAGKKIADFFRSRRYNIETELSDLDRRKQEAQKKLSEVEKSIANLEQERAQILSDAKSQGETLKESIIENAHKAAAHIREQAKNSAQLEAKNAVDNIRAEMAELVTEAAEKMLQEKLTQDEHEKLVDKYLTKVVLN